MRLVRKQPGSEVSQAFSVAPAQYADCANPSIGSRALSTEAFVFVGRHFSKLISDHYLEGFVSMAKSFFKITNKDELAQLISDSKRKPVVVFKHSTSCPISSRAYREMEQVNGDVSLVVIQSARDVSRALEQVTGVRHESPQVIVLKDGKAVWSASHYDVQAGAVAKAVEANS